MITAADLNHWNDDGYVVKPGLFSKPECDEIIAHFMKLREAGKYEGDFDGVDLTSNDPLKKYPRMIHMHRWDEFSMKWMIDSRINECLTGITGRSPYAVQTMLYFKPGGARGQALHQDQFYLKVQPGTSLAAWLALDVCDEATGCIRVVPGSHKLPLLCTTKADTTQSFTDVTVPVPADLPVVPVLMQPGNMLFFNGELIHGSLPNTTKDRFRRALIGHYISGEAEQVAHWYHPAYRMDGSVIGLGSSPDGGPCGVWVDKNGTREVVMTGSGPAHTLHE
jgi:hypothetical protein